MPRPWSRLGQARWRTLYRIGSVTKTFTTALVPSLRDEGRLALDAPAERYWHSRAPLI